MTEVINPWGPLGKPSQEKIQEWANLPYGEFTKLVKTVSRKKRGKTMSEHTVYVCKEITDRYYQEVKVMAYDVRDAICIANGKWQDFKNLEFSDEPNTKNVVRYSVHSYVPSERS